MQSHTVTTVRSNGVPRRRLLKAASTRALLQPTLNPRQQDGGRYTNSFSPANELDKVETPSPRLDLTYPRLSDAESVSEFGLRETCFHSGFS